MPAWRSAIHLPTGRLLGAPETAALFPAVDRRGLQGGALWHDAVMLSPERVAIEMLRWACACGAARAELCRGHRAARRPAAPCGASWPMTGSADRELRLARLPVFNAAGPWSRDLARAWDRTYRRCSGRRWRSTCCWTGRRSPRSPSRSSPGARPRRPISACPGRACCWPARATRPLPEDCLDAARQPSAGGRVPGRPECRRARPRADAGRCPPGLCRPAAGAIRRHDRSRQPRGDPRSWRGRRPEGAVQRQRRQVHHGPAGRRRRPWPGLRPIAASGAAGGHAPAAGARRVRRRACSTALRRSMARTSR